ncbi:hypothetical protein CYLTODRAFT_369482 [Cylindrobasidium torrendii FP15055 ss-10]|uniref:DUF7587 domain-containing protein n=1 Tax=Cylindrobasidium torrendii FP15055 ss-10 TaxID=1314674 RepID=A0A0D7BMC8_9AGAR|nr:hypothetical protein CYLTODRAFT_369482 [Cylindrobasidium torrendii FP15055 ss-10]
MSTDSLPPPPASFLPQFGFADEVSFERLAEHNPFLFRVYTPKAHDSDATYDKDIFCVAPRFNALYHSPIDELTELTPAGPIHEVTSCSDIVQHMEWTTRSSSAYLTTSMSFAWAIWEAMRRYTNGFKHDVEIAVLDARALQGRAVTAYHIMKDAPLEDRPDHFGRWSQYAQESQSVLVYGYIPMTAVLTSIPVRTIIDKLPSYFYNAPHDVDDTPALDKLAFDFSNKKMTFKHFCGEATKRYFLDTPEVRLHEAVVDSVRLSSAFLQSWFHETVKGDMPLAVKKVTDLAVLIAGWADSDDTAGLDTIIRGMVTLLAQEIRTSTRSSEQVTELVHVIDDLEGVVHALEGRLHRHERSLSGSLSDSSDWMDDRTVYSPEASMYASRNKPECESPTPLRIKIPPPGSGSESGSSSPVTPLTPNSINLPSHSGMLFKEQQGYPQTPPPLPNVSLPRAMTRPPLRGEALSSFGSSSGLMRYAAALGSPPLVSSQTFAAAAAQVMSEELAKEPMAVASQELPRPPMPEPEQGRSPYSAAAAVALGGFVIGSIITFCAANAQRRTILLHLT